MMIVSVYQEVFFTGDLVDAELSQLEEDGRPHFWFKCMPNNVIQPFITSCDECNIAGDILEIEALTQRFMRLYEDHKKGAYRLRTPTSSQDDDSIFDEYSDRLIIRGKDRMHGGPI